MNSIQSEKSRNTGHRKRLRDKFIQSGFDGFLDYEVVELLLTLGTPRKDCKIQAKEIVKKFKDLPGALMASNDDLKQVKGVGNSNSIGIQIFRELQSRYSREKLNKSNTLNNPADIFEYLKYKIGSEQKEHFVILYFNTKNILIHSEVSIGTLNASMVHPREVFHQAILNHASHVIIAHNHPSGDPTPSDEDITTTSRLVEAGKILGIAVVDHMIITSDNYTSLKQLGYINQ